MALRNIVYEGDEILRKRAREVTEINDHIRMILDDMLETMRAKNGVGIAAPQVGILRRMFIAEVDGEVIELINPEILETEGVQAEDEGCLSVPGRSEERRVGKECRSFRGSSARWNGRPTLK
jgi:peptide deformylase